MIDTTQPGFKFRLQEGSSQLVTSRFNPCKCGCRGRDPWHAKDFTRKIKNVNVLPAAIDVLGTDNGSRFTAGATADVKLPSGPETVYLWISGVVAIGWRRARTGFAAGECERTGS